MYYETVSVIVTNFNYAHFLPQRLESIINQTYKPSEIIFLDDASTDDSVTVSERILENSGIPYRIIKNDKNEGCFNQWARGIMEAKYDLIWIAEADDFCEPTLLETLTKKFYDPEVGLTYCQSLKVDVNGNILGDYLDKFERLPKVDKRWRSDYINDGKDEVSKYMSIRNTIVNASAVLMRRDLLLKIVNSGEPFEQAGDWYTYVQLLKHCKIAYSAIPLNFHRLHDANTSFRVGGKSNQKFRKNYEEIVRMQNLIRAEFNIDFRTRFYIYAERVRLIFRNIMFH